MVWRCECCGSSKHIQPYRAGGKYLAYLCAPCATPRQVGFQRSSHARQSCLMCGTPTWTCAFIKHLVEVHPLLLEKLTREPQAHFEAPASPTTYLGRVRFDKAGKLPGGDD